MGCSRSYLSIKLISGNPRIHMSPSFFFPEGKEIENMKEKCNKHNGIT